MEINLELLFQKKAYWTQCLEIYQKVSFEISSFCANETLLVIFKHCVFRCYLIYDYLGK